MKHHIKFSDSKYTVCGILVEVIRCRPRYGFCNLKSGHLTHHDVSIKMPDNMISLADDNDPDSSICETCLVESY
jgi:hypothetical protein